MEVRIGVLHQQGDLSFESNLTPDAISQALTEAIEANGTLDLTDTTDKRFLVPAANVAYVVVGPEKTRRVGFGSL